MEAVRNYDNVSDLKSVTDDGYIQTDAPLKNNDFKSERHLSDYIETNIELFCSEICNDVYIDHTANKPFEHKGRRIDLFIECEKSLFVIELKNPRHMNENVGSIGQILDYGRRIKEFKKVELIVITTKFCVDTAKTIKHYHLPIRYIYFSKSQSYEYIGSV